MPDFLGYGSHLSTQAAAFIVSLPRRQQRLILNLAGQLSSRPFAEGDYRTMDASGREIENLLCDGYLFTYWVDHAAKEIRITEIIKV